MTALLAALLLIASSTAAVETKLDLYVSTFATAPDARRFGLSMPGGGVEEIFFEGIPFLTSTDIASADAVVAPGGGAEIRVRLGADAARTLLRLTSRSMGKRVGIVVEGRLRAAPVIRAAIPDGVLVFAVRDAAEAESLARRLGPPAPRKGEPAIVPDAAPDAVALRLLEGTWKLTGATLNGRVVPDRKFTSGTWTFHDGTLVATNGEGETARFTLATDLAAPDTFRIDPVLPSAERSGWMIFRRLDDRLTIAFFDGFTRRPDDLGPAPKKVVLEFSRGGSR